MVERPRAMARRFQMMSPTRATATTPLAIPAARATFVRYGCRFIERLLLVSSYDALPQRSLLHGELRTIAGILQSGSFVHPMSPLLARNGQLMLAFLWLFGYRHLLL